METEVRARIENPDEMEKTLSLKGRFLISSQENDVYLRHESDIARRLVVRIRRKNDNTALLTFKGKATGDDTAWPDIDLSLPDPDGLEKLLLGSGYVRVVSIKKNRSSYILDGFEVNLDEIDGLGSFIEIEGRADEAGRIDMEKKLTSKLCDLGVSEKDIIRKGYVVLMLERIPYD